MNFQNILKQQVCVANQAGFVQQNPSPVPEVSTSLHPGALFFKKVLLFVC